MIKHAIKNAAECVDFRQKVGCVVTDRKGKIIAQAFNKRKTHPVQVKHSIRQKKEKFFLHAEIAALVRCRKQPYTIYVARIKPNGDIGLAKPCEVCMSAILEAGVKEIVYSTNNGGFEKIKI